MPVYASYVIGAQWFDKDKTMPLVVTTKYGCDRIDFLKMFSICFNSGIETKAFQKGLPQLIAEKEVLELRLRLLNEMMKVSASELVSRRIDTVQELLRELETNIQSLLHITELEA